ncbi:aquaporin [uncultured Parabacteroides sp.]|uniref:aquaporin n=1 Tax=uncultured Parabacteroides sp. TaxID=512312 RepID=UPI00258956A7|nr:aquaporin [uncultured Parabacteroides sp.]
MVVWLVYKDHFDATDSQAAKLGVFCTNAEINNPARDLAPRFMHTILPIKDKGNSHWEYAWIPGIAPIAGSAIAAMLYYVLK